jgi:hypothetical protein
MSWTLTCYWSKRGMVQKCWCFAIRKIRVDDHGQKQSWIGCLICLEHQIIMISDEIHGDVGGGNIFGILALEVAYGQGEPWLEELLEYLEENVDYLVQFFAEKIPMIKSPTKRLLKRWNTFQQSFFILSVLPQRVQRVMPKRIAVNLV